METETEIESFAQRVKKLLESQPIISSGMEYEGKYELKKSLALIPENVIFSNFAIRKE